MNATTAVYIAVAGALGSLCRWGLGLGVTRALGSRLPWGTFAANVIGSFAIGFVMALFAQRGELDTRARLALTVGFLGGFTTYSAFAYETITLLEQRATGRAALYVALTLVLAAAACAAGIATARALR